MASTTSIQSSTASMNAAAPTMETQMQQVRYADSNQTRGAAQLRDGDPMDFGVVPYARDPYDERARIIREAQSLARVSAPNVVHCRSRAPPTSATTHTGSRHTGAVVVAAAPTGR